MREVLAFKAGMAFLALAIWADPQQPPPAPKPPVKATVKITSEDIPPTPPYTKVHLVGDTKITDPDALVVWFVTPIDKCVTEQLSDNECDVLVRSDIPETTFTYFWVVKQKGKQTSVTPGTFKAGKGPRPPPPPDPDDPDPPPPDPPNPDNVKLPFPQDGFYAMFFYQDTDFNSYSPSHKAAIGGAAVANYLNAKATKDNTGHPCWRVFDTNQQFAGSGYWLEAHKKGVVDHAAWEAKNPGKKVPWLLVGNGKKGHSGPVPDKLDDTLALLAKYGG